MLICELSDPRFWIRISGTSDTEAVAFRVRVNMVVVPIFIVWMRLLSVAELVHADSIRNMPLSPSTPAGTTTARQRSVSAVVPVTDAGAPRWARTKSLELRLSEQIVKHDALELKAIEQLAKIRESLARIEGRLDAKTSKQRSIKHVGSN